jgi:hypothetical protein
MHVCASRAVLIVYASAAHCSSSELMLPLCMPRTATATATAASAIAVACCSDFLCGVTVTQASPPAIKPPEVITTDAYSMVIAPELNADCAVPLGGAGFNIGIKTVEAVLSYTKVLVATCCCTYARCSAKYSLLWHRRCNSV